MRHFIQLAGLIAVLLIASGAGAQSPCELPVVSTSELAYPPIAKAAHQQGEVILIVRYGTDGTVEHVQTISGLMMLRGVSEKFVRGWKSSPYTGPRECPVVVSFRLKSCPDTSGGSTSIAAQPETRSFIDPQHYLLQASIACIQASIACIIETKAIVSSAR